MRQKLSRIIKVFGPLYLPFVLLLLVGLLFALGWSTIRPISYQVSENQVASQTIRANRTVEDSYATQINQKLAAEGVADVYAFDGEKASKQVTQIQLFFAGLEEVMTMTSAQILQGIGQEVDTTTTTTTSGLTRLATSAQRVQYFRKSLDQDNLAFRDFALFIPDWVIEGLLLSSLEDLQEFQAYLEQVVTTAMSQPIRQANLSEARETAKKGFFYGDFTDKQRELLSNLADNAIVVNYVIDQEATKKAQEAAANAVKPVKILSGQVIIQEGQIVDAEVIRLLTLLGMTNQKKQYLQLVGFSLLVTILVVSLVAIYLCQVKESGQKLEAKLGLTGVLLLLSLAFLIEKFISLLQVKGIDGLALIFPIAAFVYLIRHVSKQSSYTVLAAVFLPLFFWFFLDKETQGSMQILVVSCMGIAGWLGWAHYQLGEKVNRWLVFWSYPLATLVLGAPFLFYANYSPRDLSTWILMAYLALSGLLSFFLAYLLLPYLDYLFEDSSILLLADLSNPNQPLLKDLVTKAPGTYHHSLMVANISANCVEAIGGDSQMVRVACYYHDIGKTLHPMFFIENLPGNMTNPHESLTPQESKEIIFGHVTKGVEILKQHQMPQFIIDICAQHHGTTLMSYFYAKAKELDPDTQEEDYRYPGPKPQTKEAAIVNIVDSAEAATRAMKEPSLEKVQKLVEQIINSRIKDHQLDQSGLTIGQLNIIKEIIVASLNGTFHSRIEYPQLTKEKS